MFRQPNVTTFVAPAEALDADEKYLLKVAGLADEGVSKFAGPEEKDPVHSIRWTFHVAHVDGAGPIRNVEGDPYELHQYTSNRTGKARGKVARAREWIEAFLGGPIEDSAIGPDLPDLLKGKVAIALFEEEEKENLSGETYTRLKILKLSPYKKGDKVQQPEKRQPVAAAPAAADEAPF